jgi:hypothetical protein
VHKLVSDTGYPGVSNIPAPPQQMYGHEQGHTTTTADNKTTAYYDQQAIAETNAYSGGSYPSTPALAHESLQQQQQQQQGYEMHRRSPV